LGLALKAQGNLPGAVACYREALRLDPKLAPAHVNLGNAFYDQKDLAGAVACYREAIRLDPKDARVHFNLGIGLRQQGRFAESLTALRRGHELGSRDPTWRSPSAQWVQQAQGYAERERWLDAVRAGQAAPVSPDEYLTFALMSQYTGHYAAVARLYSEAFALWPQLTGNPATGHRYNGACCAALSSCGQGQDASRDEAHRVRLRRQALAWLRADLAHWAREGAKPDPKARALVGQKMQYWRKDRDLAGVRDPEALAKLPDAERAEWEKLWADVDALLRPTPGTK
jgi:tetratricopeptide (TPR) repeat protein